jgi:hypothetical protein
MATASDSFAALGLPESDLDTDPRRQLLPELASFGPAVPAEEIEMDRVMYGILQNPEDTPQKRMWLGNYRDYRKKRGEEPFAYLPQAQQREQVRAHREQLPFFEKMLSGPENFAAAFPQNRQEEVEGWFKSSLDPDSDKRTTANKLFVEAMTGEAPHPRLWPVQRTLYARRHLGFQPGQTIAENVAGAAGMNAIGKGAVISEKEFYRLAGEKWGKEKADSELAEKVAGAAQLAAMSDQPLGMARIELKKLAGDRWKEFEPAMRRGCRNTPPRN